MSLPRHYLTWLLMDAALGITPSSHGFKKFLDKAQPDDIDTVLAAIAGGIRRDCARHLGVVIGGMIQPHQLVVPNHASKWSHFKL